MVIGEREIRFCDVVAFGKANSIGCDILRLADEIAAVGLVQEDALDVEQAERLVDRRPRDAEAGGKVLRREMIAGAEALRLNVTEDAGGEALRDLAPARSAVTAHDGAMFVLWI